MEHTTKWIQVPRSKHHYLHAQHGLFSIPTFSAYFFDTVGEWPAFNQEKLRVTYPVLGNAVPDPLPTLKIRKFKLPIGEVEKLQMLLYARRYSKAHLMPTFDNVAEVTRRIWEKLI